MTRTEFLKKYLLKFAVVLALLALLAYLFSHALGMTEGSLHTMAVRRISDRRITSADAYLFREERVLFAGENGLVDTLEKNGAKVRKNTTVAMFYPSDSDSEMLRARQSAIDEINRYISILKESELPAGTPVSAANGFRDEAETCYQTIRNAIDRGSFDELSSLEDSFLIGLNRYMVLSGKETSLSSILDELYAEKARLTGESGREIRDEGADGVGGISGTFYDRNYVDGYENLFTAEELATLTPARFSELRASAAPEAQPGTVGKMVYGYSWHLVMNLPNSIAQTLREGGTYSFGFPENDGRTLSLLLVSAVTGETESMLVFRSDSTPAGFDYHRVQRVEITVDETDGFYIPEAALQLRSVNGEEQDGVFVFENSIVRFRRIDVLYRGDGYCIVALPTESEITELSEGDILITSGKNLYDGKGYQ